MTTAGEIVRSSDLGTAAAPVTTSTNGTATSAATETIDAVLGSLTFTAQPGRRYRVQLWGRALSMTVANDRFSLKMRYTTDGSTPTAASTQIGHDATIVNTITGTNGAIQLPLTLTFVPIAAGGTAAVVTVRVSWTRVNGTGVATPVGTCEFWVEAVGNL
jgi:hypothetical protein